MNKLLPIIAVSALAAFTTTQAQVLVSEDFSTNFVDQAPLAISAAGAASANFDANSTIGDTNATGDAASGGIYSSVGAASSLSTRNGTRAYFTTAVAGFTNASGGVGQLHSHTAGGYATLSTGPITTVGGVANQPTPITSTFNEGDIFRVTFDLFVQANGSDSSGGINWNIKDAAFTAIPETDSWDTFHTGTIGQQYEVVEELTITAAMVSAGITSIGPQFTFFNNPGNMATDTQYAQIDNFVLERIAVPEPSTYALLSGMLALSAVMIRRRK